MRRPACRWRSPTWQPERVAREATRVSVSRSRSPLRTQRSFPLWRRARKQRRRQGERNGKIMEDYTKAAIRFGGQTCGAGAAPAGLPRSGPFVGREPCGCPQTGRVCDTYRVILHRGAEHQSKRRETLAYTSTRTHATGPTGVRTIDFGLISSPSRPAEGRYANGLLSRLILGVKIGQGPYSAKRAAQGGRGCNLN